MKKKLYLFCFVFLISCSTCFSHVATGLERFLSDKTYEKYRGKRLGLIVNQTSVDSKLCPTHRTLQDAGFTVAALFAVEHGIDGSAHGPEKIHHSNTSCGIPILSLYGETKRPTKEMLEKIDVLVFDMQSIGCRSYTYENTLLWAMEEAVKYRVPVLVFDRPNPMGGNTVDGTMLEEKFRSLIGYIDVPYCHGMTVGELAAYFNGEYKIGCSLEVVPMKGWRRKMVFADTDLPWIPPSPHIPESDTPFFYATTGILGEIGLVNIGVGYTLPFKVVGAPWIDAEKFANHLNGLKLGGVHFQPFHYRPFFGSFKEITCHGVLLVITDPEHYQPTSTGYALMGILKSLYPEQMTSRVMNLSCSQHNAFCKTNGTEKILNILQTEKYATWKLLEYDKAKRAAFCKKREKYLLYID